MSNQYGKHCLKQTVSFNMRYSSVVICFYFCFCFWVFFIVLFCFLKLFIKIVIPKKSCILTFLKVTLSEAWIFLDPFIIRNRKQKKKKEQLFIFGP